jgi:hypothetical protein
MVVLKGVDGVYADFPSGTRRIFNYVGSQSDLFAKKVENNDENSDKKAGNKKSPRDTANSLQLCTLLLLTLLSITL